MADSDWLRALLVGLAVLSCAMTLLSLSRRAHWVFRLADFPRVQIAVVAAASAISYAVLFFEGSVAEVLLLLASAAVFVWQLYRIHTYTPFVRPTVRRVRNPDPENRISLLISNVLMENNQHDRLLELIRKVDPDVIVAAEIDQSWNQDLEPLTARWRWSVRQPQDNYYGMALFSRLELVDPRIEFLVQEDIPSIHTGVRLPSGVVVNLHALHPRPPEPIRDQPSSPRDAELVVVGRSIGERKGKDPTIVAGDLNDVAWSSTSELFVRLSGLLDPRAGRGFFNSYNAKNPLLRYPLDHVFHSIHFELIRIERLPSIGSDHFPIHIELQYAPEAASIQEPSHRNPHDEELADEKLEQEAEDAATGADRPRGE